MNPLLSIEEVNKEILHSAKEWGLQPMSSSRDRRFCEEIQEIAVESLESPASLSKELEKTFAELRTKRLPLERDVAIRTVLASELKGAAGGEYMEAEDTLRLNFQPFYQNKRTGQYERRREYQRFGRVDLDPFKRFTGIQRNAEDWHHHIWHQTNTCLQGTVFEALVAQHMECHMACESCKCRKSLRWNGGFDKLSSWSDAVCVECHATYEIKSKADIDKVEKALTFNNIQGSSFKTFYKYHPGHTRYLVLVCRAASFSRNEGMAHRVSIGKIDRVLPRLVAESFVETNKDIRVRSEIQMKRATVKKAWFHIPEYQGDFSSLAGEVYSEEFGPGKWDRKWPPLVQAVPQRSNTVATSTEEEGAQEAKEEDASDPEVVALSSTLASLDALKLGRGGRGDDDDSSDGWENLCYGNDLA